MRIFQFRTKSDQELKEAIDKLVKNTAPEFDKIYIECLLDAQKMDIVDLLAIDKMSDKQIFEKYRYTIWQQVPKILRFYLAKRFGWYYSEKINMAIPSKCAKIAYLDEPVGIIMEKCANLNKKSNVAAALENFSEDELIDIFEYVCKAINRKKEERSERE